MPLSVMSLVTRRLDGTAERVSGLAQARTMPCLAAACCVLGLIGGGFDHSLVVAAAAPDASWAMIDRLTWAGLINDALFGSLGIVAAMALLLALCLWIAPSAPRRRTPP